jgi:anti-sigma B factor antagonist
MHVTVTSDPASDTTIVHLDGSLDIDSRAKLDAALGGLLDEGASRLVVDLSGLTFCDSTGLSALLFAHRRCEVEGGPGLAAPSSFLLSALGMVGLASCAADLRHRGGA